MPNIHVQYKNVQKNTLPMRKKRRSRSFHASIKETAAFYFHYFRMLHSQVKVLNYGIATLALLDEGTEEEFFFR